MFPTSERVRTAVVQERASELGGTTVVDKRASTLRGAGMSALEAWRDLDCIFRFNLFFFSGFLPLLGASTVWRSSSASAWAWTWTSPSPPASSSMSTTLSTTMSTTMSASTSTSMSMSTIVGLVGVALCFHAFAYVLNDVVDLPSDRSNPWRSYDPMVRGALKRGHALAMALLAVAISFPLTVALGGGAPALAVLAGGYACMAIYDLFGKRTRVPPFTDAAQGAAWGSLVVLGAFVADGVPNAVTWIATFHTVFFVIAMNGVHGGLRDLSHDLAHESRTTAIILGARPDGDGRIRVTGALRAFASAATLALMAVVTIPIVAGSLGYVGSARYITLLAVGVLDIGIIALLVGILRPDHAAWPVRARMHIVLMFALLPVALGPLIPAPVHLALLAILGISFAALIASDTWFKISRNSPNWGGVLQ